MIALHKQWYQDMLLSPKAYQQQFLICSAALLAHTRHRIQCLFAINITACVVQGLEEYKAKYAVDEVHYTEDMPKVLAQLQPVSVHLLSGTNTDRYTCTLLQVLSCMISMLMHSKHSTDMIVHTIWWRIPTVGAAVPSAVLLMASCFKQAVALFQLLYAEGDVTVARHIHALG